MTEEQPADTASDVEPIELEAEDFVSNPPQLAGFVEALKDPEAARELLAEHLVEHALECVRQFGDFHMALSGGSTPMPLYRNLMLDPKYRRMPWRKTHLWIVDERRVPFDDDKSNFKHINEIIGEHSDIPKGQLHPIEAMYDDADVRYEKELREALGWREKGQDRLDFVLLGMGPDGHTASLFPDSPAFDVTDRLMAMNDGPTVVPPERVTMTRTLINGARLVSVLVLGKGKAEMINRVATGNDEPRELPIKSIKPIGGALRWYLDEAACSYSAG